MIVKRCWNTGPTTASTDQYVVMIRVTILNGRKGCLGSRMSLIWERADIARVITVGPLEKGKTRKKEL